MPKRKKARGQRTPVGRVKEKVARVGAIAKGRQPGSNAPVTLPGSANPRIKPRGTASQKNGRPQSVARSKAIVAKTRAKPKKKR